MANWIMLAVLLVSVAVPLLCYAEDVKTGHTMKKCDTFTYMTCPCGNDGGFVSIPVKLCYMKDQFLGKRTCKPCAGHEIDDKFCDKYQNCQTCVSGSDTCVTCPFGKFGKLCTEDAPIMSFMSFIDVPTLERSASSTYPIVIRIPRGGFPPHLRGGRFSRDAEGCPVPDNLETAEVECTIWPKHISCNETCVFGYTLSEGTSREISCKFEEDTWKPSDFDECKPYIDCSVELISAGDVFCTSGKMKSGTTCDINCEEYEGDPAVPKTKFECQANGEWSPPLPFCVEKGKKEATVVPPGNKGGPIAAPAGIGGPLAAPATIGGPAK